MWNGLQSFGSSLAVVPGYSGQVQKRANTMTGSAEALDTTGAFRGLPIEQMRL